MASTNNFYPILSYISSAFAIIPFVIAISRKKYLLKEFQILGLLIALSIITDLTSNVFSFRLKLNNILILNIYIILETLLISIFYFFVISNKTWKTLILIFIILFSTYSIIQFDSKNNIMLDNIALSAESISITIFSISTFHYILKYQIYSNILSSSVFWVNSGFLLFFSGNLILHLFSQFLQEFAQKAFYELWGFHSILNIILYWLISIGFWKTKTSQI